jgi:hypothetical protein
VASGLRLVRYAAKLVVITLGCTSVNCPFKENRGEDVGTSNVCGCKNKALNLIDLIRKGVEKL